MARRNAALSALVWITVIGIGLGCVLVFLGVLALVRSWDVDSWVGPWLTGLGLGLAAFGLLASLFALAASAVVKAIENASTVRRTVAKSPTATTATQPIQN
ncbi:hypothetical protein [Humibacter ginsenosidimutans]|uniref:Uncharacterized protein n=1 Tax=Humibacter ginsenosidimutans TaxID=2599293 RepID=A0A5B8M6H0_9MICO|nr:hypothetical protein [Humibacter ginsenosidimutans]QDZ15110.1 hypothetical protein FPZ11_10300 [Humibacter ginsenosidimutans]